MKLMTILFLFVYAASCRAVPGELEPKEQIISLQYVAFACDCANWVKPEDLNKPRYEDSAVYIEPADSTQILPDTLTIASAVIRFTGRFYKEKGYPKNYHSIENPSKARVFRYEKYVVSHDSRHNP